MIPMKTAFFLVLLANLTLWMYEYHRGAFDQRAEAPAPDAAILREPIVLAAEQRSGQPSAAEDNALAAATQDQGNMQKPAAAPPLVPQELKPASFACYEAGPFASEQILKTWSQAVIEVQGQIKPVLHNAQEILDYLVLYPTAGSREDIKAAMQTLRDQGVSDAYPLATGEYKGYISLGAFHRENRAVRMQNDLQRQGVEAVVKPRFKETAQKYALFTGPVTIADRLAEMEKKYPMIQLKALPENDPNCPANRSAQSASPVAELSESGTKPPILPETRKAESSASYNSVASAENTPLKTDKPAIQKTPVQPAQKQQKEAIEAKPARFVCYEAGPFPNEPSLSAWQKQIAGSQGAVKPLFRDGKVISDYLVLYPSAGGKEAAKANMQLLRERGINDAWPLPAGEEKGQISLGVFNREENASQMQKSLLGKGVNSIVKPRYKSKRQRYALITGPESISGGLKALEKNHPDIKLRRLPDTEHNCPQTVQH
jgi:hypothetical protein